MKSGIQHYEKIARHYMATAPDAEQYHRLRFETFNSLLPKESGTILDFGCGSGENLVHMANLGHTVAGIDPVPELTSQAISNLAKARPREWRVEVGTAFDLQMFDSSAYDCVAALSVLSYLSEAETEVFYSETRRLLKPGGILVASYSNMLVDLATFNRFTVAFWRDRIIPELSDDEGERAAMLEGLTARLAFPDEPKQTHSENDLVTRTKRNPLTIADELSGHGFEVEQTKFMHFHPLPPQYLEGSPFKDLKYRTDYPDWMGPLFASMFVVRARPV